MSAAAPAMKKTIAELRAEKVAAAAAAAAPGVRGAISVRGRRPATVGRVPAATGESVFKSVQRDAEQPEVIKFRLAPTHYKYANVLRRTIITDVETVAFRADILSDGSTADVKVLKNTTPMSNEMLAHRIGLLPVHVTKPLEWNPEKYTFKLNVTNESSDLRDVTASDIEIYEDRGPEEEPLRIPNVQFFPPNPITKDTPLLAVLKGKTGLQETEKLEFVAKATLGTGRENARFMPVTSRCAYGFTLDEDPARRAEFFNRWLVSHKKVNPTELDSDKKEQFEREFKTMEIQRCFLINEQGEPYSFDFVVESVGVLDPVYIVGRALEILQAKLLRLASIDAGDLPDGLRIIPAEARGALFDFIFQREDHTLGNLLQTWLEQNHYDSGEITFAGYKVPHPLRDEMVLRVGVEDGKELTARAMVAKAARGAAQMFREWGAAWASATTGL